MLQAFQIMRIKQASQSYSPSKEVKIGQSKKKEKKVNHEVQALNY